MNTTPLTIVSLDVTNFARIKAVHLEPDPSGAVVISGRNAQGKSSVLAAIAQVIDSSKYKLPVPVHLGAEAANIVAVLGRDGVPELVVKWRMTESGKKTFTVEDADGIKKSAPAALMKSLFGMLSVNPFEFATAGKDAQLKILLGTTGFDVDDWKERRKQTFGQRTIINREVEKRKKSLDMLPAPAEGTPRDVESTSVLLQKISTAEEVERNIAAADESVVAWQTQVENLTKQLEEAKVMLETALTYQHAMNAPENVAIALTIPDLRTQLDNIDVANDEARAAQRYDELAADLENYIVEAKNLTGKIGAIDKELSDAVASINLPIRGLTFVDDELRLNDIPFEAASHAEKITIGTALAIASQPEAGVILVEDASLMDSTTTSIITQMAQNHGMQVWLETVGETDGVVIEDGEIRG